MSGLRYDQFVEDALRTVVRRTLKTVSETGLTGNHHLYITFATHQPGVDIPAHLKAQYPEEMTIVLQHQFWGLDVDDDRFGVTLSFNKIQERLEVPFAAVTAFADPSVSFGLQFKSGRGDGTQAGRGRKPELPAAGTAAPVHLAAPAPGARGDLSGKQGKPDRQQGRDEAGDQTGDSDKVVTLDAFRKK